MKKSLTVAGLLMAMFFLVGFGSKTVELWEKAPLIDLDAAIKNASLGKQGNQAAMDEEKEENPEQENTQRVETQLISKEQIIRESVETYQISVQGETIKFDNEICKDSGTLESLIVQNCTEKSKVILEDDYAETHVYHNVLRTIEHQKGIIGFEFQQK